MSEITIERIADAAVIELWRRLQDPDEAQNVPGTALLAIVKDILKMRQEQAAYERALLDQKKLDPLEMIDQPGLSLARRIQILTEYIGEIEDTWRRASTILEGLLHGDDSTVPELQNLVSEAW